MIELFVSENYTRDINPLKNYAELSSFYLSRVKGVDISVARKWVNAKLDTTTYPQIKFLERQSNGDRVIKYQPLDEYYADVIGRNRLMAGTGTVYKQPSEEKSLFTTYINEGRAARKVFKDRMLVAKQAEDNVAANFNNELQSDEKISNNTLSGATTTVSTVIYMGSAHPSLASTGRLATSFANAINEDVLRGNRHYNTPAITLDAMTVLAYTADTEAIQSAVDEFNIVIPSVDDVMELVSESSKHYWRNKGRMATIRAFVETTTDIERCNIYYTGSLWDLSKLNPRLIYQFLDELSEPAIEPISLMASREYIKAADGDLRVLASYLCFKHMTGKQLYNLDNTDPDTYCLVGATVKKLSDTLYKYASLIVAFLKLKTLPGNIYDIKSMYRKAVVTSDTDSTNFTCQELCKFVTGAYGLSDKDRKITFLLTYISSMMVMQALGIMSRNMGVGDELLRELSMKNEYYIPIHCLTTAAKNYIMVQGGQEGNLLPVLELVTKGVELRSSKIPKTVLERFERYKEKILLSLEGSIKLTTVDVLTMPVTLEYMISESLKNLETTWVMTETIKNPEAYARKEQESKVKNHNFYEAVFAPKYGHIYEIPYDGYQIDSSLGNKSAVMKWVEGIQDEELKERAREYVIKNKITKISRFNLPKDLFSNTPVPIEMVPAIDHDNMVMKVMSPWYAFLETFGIFLRNKHHSKMLIKVFPDFADLGIFEQPEEVTQIIKSTFIETEFED